MTSEGRWLIPSIYPLLASCGNRLSFCWRFSYPESTPCAVMLLKTKHCPTSQAGRRRFESGLPLHLVNHLQVSPNQLLSHLSQLDADGSDLKALKSDQSAVPPSCFRATEESTYLSR